MLTKPLAMAKRCISVRARLRDHRNVFDDPFTDVPDLKSLPPYQVKDLANLKIEPWTPSDDVQPISTEVMTITGSTAAPITNDVHVFYDTEIIAIIQRTKSKSKGLVVTNVWAWIGKHATLGDKENKKLHELAKRYGTTLVRVEIFSVASFADSLCRVLSRNTSNRQTSSSHSRTN
jgi:hypothetical protein